MHAWKAIQNALDYIEVHLSEEIRTETLADISALSLYYFQRLFHRLVGRPVNEYIKLRRLAKASEALKSKGKTITEIALDCGFLDHATFTRAFKAAYRITPQAYRRNPVILNRVIKPDLHLRYIELDENVPLITEGMVLQVNRRYLERPRCFTGVAGKVPIRELFGKRTTGISATGAIWNEFHLKKDNIPNLLPGGSELGILFEEENAGEGCVYMAGAEVSEISEATGRSAFTLPEGEYAVCRYEAENFAELIDSAVFKASAFMGNWMKKQSLACGAFAAEVYFESSSQEAFMELWLPICHQAQAPMIEFFDKTDQTQVPTLALLQNYVNNPLWEQLCEYVEVQCRAEPILEFSRCSMQKGWNVKFRKSSRSLCTLYPSKGSFTVLVVVGEREKTQLELALPLLTEYLQCLYRNTKAGMGQKWLMIHVTNKEILEDVKQCLAIRMQLKRK